MPETTHATLHHLVDKRFVGTIPDGRQVLIDGTKEHPLGMGPMQLLLNAWGGCVAYDVVEMLKKRRVEVRSYRIELEGDRDEGVPRSTRTCGPATSSTRPASTPRPSSASSTWR
jgi:putative redox protein